MSDSTNTTRIRLWRSSVRFIGMIVPRRFRARFRQEWEAVLLRRLPYANPDRLVVLWERQLNVEQEAPSYPNFLDWQAQSQSFDLPSLP